MTREGKGRTSEEERGEGFGVVTETTSPPLSYGDIMSPDQKGEKKQQQGLGHVKDTRKYSKDKVRQKFLLHVKTNWNSKRSSPSLLKMVWIPKVKHQSSPRTVQ